MRTFAFVDGVDEVTAHLKDVASFLEVRHVLFRADVVARRRPLGLRGGVRTVLGAAGRQHRSALDGHHHRRRSQQPTTARRRRIEGVHARARRVYLLNPEPAAEWNTTDSIVDVYRPYLDEVFEVRNLRQLADAVLRIG